MYLLVPVIFLVVMRCAYDVQASAGDHSWKFQRCLQFCTAHNCTSRDKLARFEAKQPLHMKLLRWSCSDECDYMCMWVTVDAYQKDNSPIPQFHGKWPFVRMFGIQEPASVIFSILNAIPHIVMIAIFRRKVPSRAPMYYVWHLYALIAVVAWFWSTVFHTRDFPITERMDYFCAVMLVVMNFYCFLFRVLGNKSIIRSVGYTLLSFYAYHVYYLAFVRFDYGYNMKVNVSIGALSSVAWLTWCQLHKRRRPYVWKCASTVILTNTLLLLELWDFPPIWWTFDAHSLWHAGTSQLGWLWYSFIIDDSLHRLDESEQSLPSAKKKPD